MGFFSSKPDFFLGVDFGMQSIKAAELKMVKDKVHLSNYAYVDIVDTKEAPESYDKDHAQKIKDALVQLLKAMKPRTKLATVAIPSFNGFVTIVDFPRMSEKEVADAIQYESTKYIPASLDEVNVSWEILDDEDDQKKQEKNNKAKRAEKKKNKQKQSSHMKVLLVAAPKSEVQYYDSLFKDVEVDVESLELESFSLARSIIGNTKGRFVLMDIGAKTTNIVLVEDGVIHINRSVDIGGFDITGSIMQSLNITRERAVALKESGENFFTGVTKVTFPSLDYISNEVKRVLSTQKSDKIEALVLSGGSAKLVGLVDHIKQLTGLNTVIGNPLSHIIFDENNSGKIKEKSPEFAVALGLALRATEYKK